MPGFILHIGASVLCAHGGQAQPATVGTRVTVSGQPVCLQPMNHIISGCTFVTPGGNPQPCLTANWLTASTRVTSMGMPVLLMDSQAVCVPNGTPLIIAATQTRVSAT